MRGVCAMGSPVWLIRFLCILQSLGDDAKATGQTAADTAAEKTQAARDAMTPNQGHTGTKSLSGPGSTSGVQALPAASHFDTPQHLRLPFLAAGVLQASVYH